MNHKLKIITSIAVIASIIGMSLTADVKAMDVAETMATDSTTEESVVTTISTTPTISEGKHYHSQKNNRPIEPPEKCEDDDKCNSRVTPKISFDEAKSRALRRIENVTQRVENIKTRTQEKHLAENVKEIIIAELDKDLDYLKQMKTRIENATTKEELLQIRKELREHTKGRKKEIMQKAGKQINSNVLARMENALNISNTVISKLNGIINELKEKGIDTTEAEKYLSEAQSQLNNANSLYETAKTQVEDGQSFRATAKEFRNLIKQVKKNIKLAGNAIKQVAPTPTTD